MAPCLIRHVIVTGEAVDLHCILPFAPPAGGASSADRACGDPRALL
jgi:hypothetical protein